MQKTLGIVAHRVTEDWKLRTEVIGLVQVAPGEHCSCRH
jgi:hypothetical protein